MQQRDKMDLYKQKNSIDHIRSSEDVQQLNREANAKKSVPNQKNLNK